MRKLMFAAIAASTAFATPALAQQADGPFNGPRVGVLAGWDGLRPGSTDNSSIRGNGADGVVYGGDVGYDAQIGRSLVIGAEGEITGSTAKAKDRPFSDDDFGYGRVKSGRDLYIGGRVGFLAAPATMIYAKGGYTNARLDLTRYDADNTETGRHYNLDGYRIGAGVEQALSPRTYAKLEYRYSNYGNARLEYPNGANIDNFSVDTDRHQVVAGVGFRF